MMITTIAKKVYTITWDGTDEEAVNYADYLAKKNLGHGIDTPDYGDATGIFCEIADLEATQSMEWSGSMMLVSASGRTLTIDVSWENFQHKGLTT